MVGDLAVSAAVYSLTAASINPSLSSTGLDASFAEPAAQSHSCLRGRERACRFQRQSTFQPFFGDFRGILSRAEIEFAEEEKDSGSEVVEGAEAARIGLDGLDA